MIQKAKRRHLGQNFLINRRASKTIVQKFKPDKEDVIVEIGPGRGALTEYLVKTGANIYAIEADDSLCILLKDKFKNYHNLTVINGNILNYNFNNILEKSGVKFTKLRVIGNIPYHISKPLLMKLISERYFIHDFTLMLQKEVTERIISTPGSKKYSPLSVLFALTSKMKRVMELSPGSFSPAPKVYSSVISCSFFNKAIFRNEEELILKKIIAALFSKRRKTIKNNLAALLKVSGKKAASILERCGFDPLMRAENLHPEDFLKIARFISAKKMHFGIMA